MPSALPALTWRQYPRLIVALLRRLAWLVEPLGPSYMAALAYLSIMPPGRAALALHARATVIADEARRLQGVLDRAGAPEVHMIEVHYLLTRLQHDRQWLIATARRMETGELAWP